MNLTQSAPLRQETFTPGCPKGPASCEIGSFDPGFEGEGAPETTSRSRPPKLHKRPDFVTVPRAALKHPKLDVRDALALSLVLYRDRIGSRIGASEIAQTFGWDRTTGWRALTRLREVGLLDRDDAPIAGSLSDQGGFLKVRLEHVRELGNLEAVTLIQLQSYGALRMSRLIGRHMVVTARGLSSLIGCCVDTATDVLKRLSSGLTNRVKRAQRKGQSYTAKARLELVRALGRATRVRLLGEREQKPTTQSLPSASRSGSSAVTAGAVGTGYVPSAEELRAMLSAAKPSRAT